MTDTAAYRYNDVEPFVDPTTGSGDVWMFPDGMGQNGTPFVMRVADPPNKTRPAHHHKGDVIYVYVQGEHHIEGEGTYRAGDVRWTRGGHRYGPERTGSEGGTWWLVSYDDPLPIETPPEAPAQVKAATAVSTPELQRFAPPFKWDQIDRYIASAGAVIAEQLATVELVDRLNRQIDDWLAESDDDLLPRSSSALYDGFLGHRTLRLHGLAAKMRAAVDVIGHPDLVDWAERMMAPIASNVLLNAGELIQIEPGERAQLLHRDTASWPVVERSEHPVLVNAMIALTEFNEDTGATAVALGSHTWESDRRPQSHELLQPTMQPGDALLLRGDLLHGGGANRSEAPRRGLSLTYCAGWLRTVENGVLNVPPRIAATLPRKVQELLGYSLHDATGQGGGIVGLYECSDPEQMLHSEHAIRCFGS